MRLVSNQNFDRFKSIKLVTLDNAYHTSENPLSKEAFWGIIQLRAEGYGPDYPKTYLPLDAVDYVCRHHLICYENEGVLFPIGAYRQVLLKTCDFYGLKMPLLSMAEASQAETHCRALNQLFEDHRARGIPLSYSAGMTIRKNLRADKELSALFRELVMATHYQDSLEYGALNSLCAAVMRFKTHLWFEGIGYQALKYQGLGLSPLPNAVVDNNLMAMLFLEGVPEGFKNCYEKHKSIFEKRVFLGSDHIQEAASAYQEKRAA